MTPPRPDLAPDPTATREEMEAQQRAIADAAAFEDDLEFDPETLSTDTDGDTDDDDAPIVAGVDQAFLLEQDRAVSAIVAGRLVRTRTDGTGDFEVLERVHAVTPLEIPYVPGLLAFREGGPILEAVERLSVEPDLYLFDGSGRIHFRRAGIATHVGVVLDVPSVGVAKNLLCGTPAGSVEGLDAGERVPIEADSTVDAPEGTLLGYAVQTKQYDSPNRHVNPLYVSPGHRVGPATAAEAVLALSSGYKLPEPVRLADAYADEAKRGYLE